MMLPSSRALSVGLSISSRRTSSFQFKMHGSFGASPTVNAPEAERSVQLVLSSLRQTQELAERVAASSSTGDAILLFGYVIRLARALQCTRSAVLSMRLFYREVGSGKSEWARAFIRARTGVADLEVPSPSFVLSVRYPFPGAVEGGFIHHMDLYRLSTAQQAQFLGIEDAVRKGMPQPAY